MLTEYETTLVLRPNIGGDAIEATLDKIRGAVADGGKLLAINHWGKKRLAYEIKEHIRGVYVHTHYLGAGPMVAEIERNLRLSEDVLRYLTVKLDDAIDPATRDAMEYVAPEYDAVDEADEEEAEGAEGEDLEEGAAAAEADDDEPAAEKRDDNAEAAEAEDDEEQKED